MHTPFALTEAEKDELHAIIGPNDIPRDRRNVFFGMLEQLANDTRQR
jgi:hypothetical protein